VRLLFSFLWSLNVYEPNNFLEMSIRLNSQTTWTRKCCLYCCCKFKCSKECSGNKKESWTRSNELRLGFSCERVELRVCPPAMSVLKIWMSEYLWQQFPAWHAPKESSVHSFWLCIAPCLSSCMQPISTHSLEQHLKQNPLLLLRKIQRSTIETGWRNRIYTSWMYF